MALGTVWVANPDAMLAAMPASVWRKWQILHKIEPFGPRQEDWRAAVVGILAGSPWAKHQLHPEDYFVSLEETDQETAVDPSDDPRVQAALARAWVLARGGEIIEAKPNAE